MKGKSRIKVALAGQPNCGKSTIFNAVAGYRAMVSNFPGTTVEYTSTEVSFGGKIIELVDLPGTYSLSTTDSAELEAVKYLLDGKADVIINVVDASVLSRSLELTLELLEYSLPMVLCLNMIDEAEKKGIIIDEKKLEEKLGIPVIKTIAIKGKGIRELFITAMEVAGKGMKPEPFRYSADVERTIEECMKRLNLPEGKERLFAIKVLEGDEFFMGKLGKASEIIKTVEEICSRFPVENEMMVRERHFNAMKVFEHSARILRGKKRSLENRIDAFLLSGWRGYLLTSFFFFFILFLIFSIGGWLEEALLSPFERILGILSLRAGVIPRLGEGFVQGIAGGVAVVMPYLLPLLFFLSLAEDSGVLPRIAFILDTLMHRIGLHGKSVIPFVMGYGCTVPAIMSTKILETESERKKIALLSGLIPCSARTTVILATAGFYGGFKLAIFIYLLNIVVVAISGRVISGVMGPAPGLIMEIPPYRVPLIGMVLKKVWFRAKDFLFRAWPLLIIGSIIFSLFKVFELEERINHFLAPFTVKVLALPHSLGITLLFGILRKELAMIMAFQALGTTDISSAMSSGQIIRFALFITFYIPCLATIIYTWRNFGWRFTFLSAVFNTAIAILLTVLSRLFPG